MICFRFCVSFLIFVSTYVYAGAELQLNDRQNKAIGIVTAPLPNSQTGMLAGIPAQVVIPGNQLYIVSAPLPSMIEQTLVGVGDQVSKGQILARLQSPALAEAQRGLLQASTQEKLAHGNLQRDEQLWKDGIISESRYRNSLSLHTEAAANLAEREQMLRLSGMPEPGIKQLKSGSQLNSLLLITSPISGVVLEKSIDAGQRVDGATPLFKVARLNPLGLEIQAPLSGAAEIRIGAEVNIPGASAQGKVTAIGQSLSNSNQTLLIRAQINRGAQNLRPGQFVEVNITTPKHGALQWNIPNSAIARVDGKTMVFVETASGFRAEPVTLLHEGDQTSQISGRFTGSEKIAIRGVSSLKAKMMGIGGSE